MLDSELAHECSAICAMQDQSLNIRLYAKLVSVRPYAPNNAKIRYCYILHNVCNLYLLDVVHMHSMHNIAK